MNELRLLQHVDEVPLASWYDAGVAGTHFNRGARFRFARYPKLSRYDVKDFITIRMNISPMGRVTRHRHNSDGHTIDPLRRTWLTRSGGNRKISVDIEQMVGRVNSSDLVHI